MTTSSAGHRLSVGGAREHNLEGFDLELPHDALIVVHGVSGSGKSSLAFDTIFREGQRRYLRTLSDHTRRMIGRLPRPEIARLEGVRAALAIDQRSVVRSPRSTVGTLSEIADELRLLLARFGHRTCPACGQAFEEDAEGRRRSLTCACGEALPPLSRGLFSFNTDEGACTSCRGLGVEDVVDPDLLIADPSKTIREGALVPTTPTGYVVYSQVTPDAMNTVCEAHGFDIDTPWEDLAPEHHEVIFWGSDRVEVPFGKHTLESRMKWSGIKAKPREMGHYRGIARVISETLVRARNDNVLRFVRSRACSACEGTRLAATPRAVRVADHTLPTLLALPVSAIEEALRDLPPGKELEERVGVARIRERVSERAARLVELGLGHLALDRASSTLSAGEARRLRLATQLGIDLAGLTIVFDEPSAGAHVAERSRIARLLAAMRDRGNTVILVEHDPIFRRHADHLVEIGPGAGTEGGRLVRAGAPREEDLTGPPIDLARDPREAAGWIVLRGAEDRHLDRIDVRFGRGILNVVTGVSGSGKSTLVDRTLARALARKWHGATAIAGEHAGIDGLDGLRRVVLVDQSEIGRSPRSNPATYSGVFDAIRTLYASQPDARSRGLDKGAFSFNKKGGRCEHCEGAGVEVIGLMGHASVPVRCPVCDGQRFRPEVLEVRHGPWSILDALEGTITAAREVFAGEPKIERILDALIAAGLGYLRLGQPATTLSGGEAQRLKLATELARGGGSDTIIVLDEPTSGLHPDDVRVILDALDALIANGATIIAVEHDLAFIAAADHVVDLGPGSGEEGGRMVVTGPPAAVAAHATSATGRALAAAASRSTTDREATTRTKAPDAIMLRGVRTNGLKDVDATFPLGALTAISGVSGSGKTSLAFETLAAEGRRHFAESLSPHLRRDLLSSGRAQLDATHGLRPTVAIRTAGRGASAWSTVGTVTGADLLVRLLFARAATAPCPACKKPGRPGACSCGGDSRRPWTASHFSARSPLGACPRCEGRGVVPTVSIARLIEDRSLALRDGALASSDAGRQVMEVEGRNHATLLTAARERGIDLARPWDALDASARHLILEGTGEITWRVDWEHARAKGEASHTFEATWPGLTQLFESEYAKKRERKIGPVLARALEDTTCPACHGSRRNPEASSARVGCLDLGTIGSMPINHLLEHLEDARAPQVALDLDERQAEVWSSLAPELLARLERLPSLGLGYLTLDRHVPSLSAGERRRVEIAAQLVSGLTGAGYVLDEPTLGLHPLDRTSLTAELKRLAAAGNAVVVIDHDEAVIRGADRVIEMGPGAGPQGGSIVQDSTPDAILRNEDSPTGRALAECVTPRQSPRGPARELIRIEGAHTRELKNVDFTVRVGELLVICGVSGSGKSTLLREVLAPSLEAMRPTGCHALHAAAPAIAVHRIEGRPLGRGPTSLVATALGVMDAIRDRFAGSPAAKERGLKRTAFTIGNKAGACPLCRGTGERRVVLDHLPDSVASCRGCGGKRFSKEVLACTIDDLSIADALDSGASTVRPHLEKHPGSRRPTAAQDRLRRAFEVLEQLGLGHLALGRRADSLSNGENQRLAIARELLQTEVDDEAEPALFTFDEPSRGLHPQDLVVLTGLFDALVARGHAVVVIEHALRVIADADRVIELGPGAGSEGGTIVFEGRPQDLVRAETPTGKALRAAAVARPAKG